MKLLLAIDLRESHDAVFAQAADLTRRLGAVLDLVYVGTYEDIYQFVTDPRVRRLMEAEAQELHDRHRADLEALLARLPEENRGRTHLPGGTPAGAITDMEGPYDALLVATHGRTGIAHLWLGSVAERIVRTSQKTVIVLRIPPQEMAP